MKAEVKIPKGFHVVKKGLIKEGDYFLNSNYDWVQCNILVDCLVGTAPNIVIRKIKRKKP